MPTGPDSKLPTNHERAVKALEEHGFLFQKACVADACSVPDYQFESEEYPVSVGATDTVIDFVIRTSSGRMVYLIFECKRANPEYVTWVFSGHPEIQNNRPVILATELSAVNQPSERRWLQTVEIPLAVSDMWAFGSSGLEIRDDSKQKNGKASKTTSIFDACSQAITGVGGLALEHQNWLTKRNEFGHFWRYIPVVVTTAELWLTNFKTSAIEIKTGNLNRERSNTKAVDWLFVDFPVPKALGVTTPEQSDYYSYGPSDSYRRKFKVKSIAIVKGTKLRDFLHQLRTFLS